MYDLIGITGMLILAKGDRCLIYHMLLRYVGMLLLFLVFEGRWNTMRSI